MFRKDKVGAFKIGDGLGDFNYFEVGAGGEVKFFGGRFEKLFRSGGEVEQRRDLMGGERGVVVIASSVAGALTV